MRLISQLLLALLLWASPVQAYYFASGSYTGDGLDNRDIDISTTSGVADFQPIFTMVRCDNTDATHWRVDSMPTGESVNTSGSVLSTTAIKQENANGFRVGTSAGANASGVTCWYIAIGDNGSNDVASGSYAGDGTDDRTIDISDTSASADFAPMVVFVKRGATSTARFRFSGMATNVACGFGAASACVLSNTLQSFVSTGFVVGNDSAVNSSTGDTDYYYFAIKSVTLAAEVGTFTGNGADDRAITATIQPKFVMMVNATALVQRCYRFEDQVGDDSIVNDGAASAANQIQALSSAGFQVGTADCVNDNGETMFWWAMKDVAVATTRPPSGAIFFR